MGSKFIKSFILLLIFSFFVGCSKNIPTIEQRLTTSKNLYKKQNLNETTYKSFSFDIYSIQDENLNCKNKTIKIFIEGDGLAWITRTTISSNPTPINPIALELMLKEKNSCKIYLARPCQYANSKNCSKKYWTSHRFSEKIIDAYLEILDKIKKKYKNSSFEMIGYSGGGAIATILSAKRSDVKELITYAGNLNIEKWSEIHNITPLYGSLNPADFSIELESLSQTHYIGKKDKIIPIEVFESFKSKFRNKTNVKLILIDGNHSKIF